MYAHPILPGRHPGTAGRRPPPPLVAALVVAAATVLAWPRIGEPGYDAEHYLQIARGEPALEPFALRFLVPKLAEVLAGWSGLPPEPFFLASKALALWAFAWALIRLLVERGVPPAVAAALPLASSGIPHLYGQTFLPDMEALALSALSLLALDRGRVVTALAIAALGIWVRETMAVFLACIALASWWHTRQARVPAAALLLAVAALLLRPHLAGPTLGNVHGMPSLLYFALKLPVNFLVNWLGIDWFTDRLSCRAPWFELPPSLLAPLGVARFGLCVPQPAWIARTVLLAVQPFGAAAAALFVPARRGPLRGAITDPALLPATLAGAVAWPLGTLAGFWVDRLVMPAWPLALFVVPVLLARALGPLPRAWPVVIALWAVCGWGRLLLAAVMPGLPTDAYWITAAALTLALEALAALVMLRLLPAGGPAPNQRTP
ncbi:hypothetical protein HRbin39_01398 [bacterium HR39]|nr:hypothetical protein HRbin39_01398 [bacterium HR39]